MPGEAKAKAPAASPATMAARCAAMTFWIACHSAAASAGAAALGEQSQQPKAMTASPRSTPRRLRRADIPLLIARPRRRLDRPGP